jgi:uncharacterized protein YdeI (YjbR/CyaY-like superfamily)
MGMERYKDVNAYIVGNPKWTKGLLLLIEIMRSTEMVETLKWGAPHYTLYGKNVVGIAAFKNHFALWFHQGAFLSDPNRLLINAQEGKTKGLRQIRFTDSKQINKRVLAKYVREAIANEKAGLSIKPSKSRQSVMPAELKQALQANSVLESAFQSLTPGRQNEYAEYIHEAKRIETKMKRLEKIIPMVLNGVGLNDQYR